MQSDSFSSSHAFFEVMVKQMEASSAAAQVGVVQPTAV
jgi:hypothetical protein